MTSQQGNIISSLAFFDLETSGLKNPGFNPEILELSILVVHRDQFQDLKRTSLPRVINKLVLCFTPKKPLRSQVHQITGLHNDELENQPTFQETSAKLINTFLESLDKPLCLIAHNGNAYDFPLLVANFLKVDAEMNSDIFCVDSLEAFRMIDEPDHFGPKLYPHIYNNHIQDQETDISSPQVKNRHIPHSAWITETPSSSDFSKKRGHKKEIAEDAISKVRRKLEYVEDGKAEVPEPSTETRKRPDFNSNQANTQDTCGSDTESTLEYEWTAIKPHNQQHKCTSLEPEVGENENFEVVGKHKMNDEHGRKQSNQKEMASLSDNELLLVVSGLEKETSSNPAETDSKHHSRNGGRHKACGMNDSSDSAICDSSGTQSSLTDSELLHAVGEIEVDNLNDNNNDDNLNDNNNDGIDIENILYNDGNKDNKSNQHTNLEPSTSKEDISPQRTSSKGATYRYNLGSLHERIVGYQPKGAHQAENDCLSLIRIFQKRAIDIIPWIDKHAKPITEIKPMYLEN